MEYMIFWHINTMYNDQIRVFGIPIISSIYHFFYWEHFKSSLLAILNTHKKFLTILILLCYWALEFITPSVCLYSLANLSSSHPYPAKNYKSNCHGLKVFLTLKSVCWNLTTNVMVLEGGTFGRLLSHEDSALMKEALERPPTPPII